jgi:flagellar biosynthesis protein FlhF
MNMKRFVARSSRDALALVRQAFGDEAVVVSTRPCDEGVEMLAMPPDSVFEFERVAAPASAAAGSPVRSPSVAATSGQAARRSSGPSASSAPSSRSLRERAAAQMPPGDPAPGYTEAQAALEQTSPDQDAERLAMSTLSFQDYVRERMLRRRKAELDGVPLTAPGLAASSQPLRAAAPAKAAPAASGGGTAMRRFEAPREAPATAAPRPARPAGRGIASIGQMLQEAEAEMSAERQGGPIGSISQAVREAVEMAPMAEFGASSHERTEMMTELRSMKGMIEERFATLAFMERLQRQPGRAALSQRLLDCGFSPSLVRKLVDKLPDDVEPTAWSSGVLERNLLTGEAGDALEDEGGVFALVGTTGVGKTTSTAKLAAAFAAKYGASNLGLITLDAYRVGAHEQLRTYGRILGVPVHIAQDRASLEDLLELLSGKKLLLIDTAGIPQRDARGRELMQMLSHPSIRKLLVINAAAQGETIEDVVMSYRAAQCHGVVLSKLDEAVKIGPALDAMIRHKLRVLAVGNGQRVPEDWHRLSAATLVQRALCVVGSNAWKLDSTDVSLMFAGPAAQPPQVTKPVRERAAGGAR